MKKHLVTKQAGIVLLCAVIASACSSQSDTNEQTSATGAAQSTAAVQTASTAAANATAASTDVIKKVEYKDEDKYTDWSASNATKIELTGASATITGAGAALKDSKISITAAGTYVVSGKLDNGQIAVNVKDKGVVRLVLNGAEIASSSTSPILVEEAGKTIISLQEGTSNAVSDGKTYANVDADGEPNSAIFSKDDLTINGTGKLVVQGNYNNGITSKDKLKVTGGTIEIKAVDDALMGRDLVAVQNGTITIESGGHSIKTSNDTAGEEGYIAIDGGTFNLTSGEDALHSSGGLHVSGGDLKINAGDDGINGGVSVAIAGGTIDIAKSNEGIEAPNIVISEGKTSVVSSDDGVNVSSGSGEAEAGGAPQQRGGQPGGAQSGANSSNKLTITGGYLSVDAKGDGLDANGSIEMSGGTVVVNGPSENGNGALDYDGTFVMTGGFLVAAGSSGMAQATSDQSTQPGLLMTYSKQLQAGTLVNLQDSAGKDMLTFAPAKSYQSLFISSPDLKKDAAYTLYTGGTSTGSAVNGLYEGGAYQGGTKVVDFTQSSVITWLSETGVTQARTGMGGPGGQGGGRRGMGNPPQGQMPPQ